MYLTLEVVSPQAASMGDNRRKTVGPKGLTIGRAPGNDWVIPDHYISKEQARISFNGSGFFVEGLGKNPLAINSPGTLLVNQQPRALRNGDRLFIDQYEVRVALMEGEAPQPLAVAAADPFADILGSPPPARGAMPGAHSGAIPDAWDSVAGGPPGDADVLDPLVAIGATAESRLPDLPPVNIYQASPLADHFDPPTPTAASSGGGIPENWELTNLTRHESPSPVSPAPVRAATPRPAPPRPAMAGSVGSRAASAPASSPAPAAAVPAATPGPFVPPPAPAPRVAAHAPVPSAGISDLAELLRGAGLPEQSLSPEVARELGQVLRVVVQGVMEALQARSEIKAQFRLPLTRVKAMENNPLKLSPNVESALHTLLVQRNPGYLATVPAFEDAFADIRSHQMAMLEGIRVAFQSMLREFEPQLLEEEFERGGKRGGLLGLGGKAKYWELYRERFERLGRDADDTFRRLFGDVFAEAYEKQLERLKALKRQK